MVACFDVWLHRATTQVNPWLLALMYGFIMQQIQVDSLQLAIIIIIIIIIIITKKEQQSIHHNMHRISTVII